MAHVGKIQRKKAEQKSLLLQTDSAIFSYKLKFHHAALIWKRSAFFSRAIRKQEKKENKKEKLQLPEFGYRAEEEMESRKSSTSWYEKQNHRIPIIM